MGNDNNLSMDITQIRGYIFLLYDEMYSIFGINYGGTFAFRNLRCDWIK